MKKIIYFFLFMCVSTSFSANGQPLTGKVIDSEDSSAVKAALITHVKTGRQTLTSETGLFTLTVSESPTVLRVSCLGYQTREIKLSLPLHTPLVISLTKQNHLLQEVVISTGFQKLPKERATGSVVKLNNELLSRRVSPDIISRLEDNIPGLSFNRNRGAGNSISIRGQSTLFSNTDPLIILDNFPYSGNIENINPNDVEDITVLKDAAAASIWGARAGNGVIVITTKRGRLNSPVNVSFNSSVTALQRPDLFYQPRMSSSDFIEVEKMLFQKGYYQSAELSEARSPLSPVVELLIATRDQKITAQEADRQIEGLKGYDIRSDIQKYLYRAGANQQYSLSLNGGSDRQSYFLSAGYDKVKSAEWGNGSKRFTFNAGNTWVFADKKAEVSAGVLITESTVKNNALSISDLGMTTGDPSSILPYTRLADDTGMPLAITRDYRTSYLSSLSGLLPWEYKPLEEADIAGNRTRTGDYKINTRFSYKVLPGLEAAVLYQFGSNRGTRRNLHTMDSWFTRDLINRFTQVSGSSFEYPVPLGAILDQNHTEQQNHNFRAQLNYERSWEQNRHALTAMAGYEIQQVHSRGEGFRFYGYDQEHAIPSKVDYLGLYRQFYNPNNSMPVPYIDAESILKDHYRSYYSNIGYTFEQKYTFSGSARLDQSNLFGVKTNQKGVPLWSAGLKWDLAKEDFYPLKGLPVLSLRLSYGHNGNVNKSLTAYTTATYLSANTIGLPYAIVTNPPNAELRWEQVRILNAGLDFASKGRRVSGSIEIYRKKGTDLIGDSPYPPSSGISTFRGNTADTKGNGADISITTRNIQGALNWSTDVIYSHILDKVTTYKTTATSLNYITDGDFGGYPLEGKPLYALYSYRWAGLDPASGDPMGYLDGEVSKDYAGIAGRTAVTDIVYNGPARPTDFGSVRNTFSWKGISLSATVSYRFGYYFRENGINYTLLLAGQGYNTGADYGRRWQQPGDESFTQVPSLPASVNTNRDNLYRYSDILVKKGDNIRLQDISLSCSLPEKYLKRVKMGALQLYAYAANLGILWKAAGGTVDPDYVLADYRPVKTFALGLRANF